MRAGNINKEEFFCVEDYSNKTAIKTDIEDAIVRLSTNGYATAALLREYEEYVIEKHDTFERLKKYGVPSHEAAAVLAVKMGIA